MKPPVAPFPKRVQANSNVKGNQEDRRVSRPIRRLLLRGLTGLIVAVVIARGGAFVQAEWSDDDHQLAPASYESDYCAGLDSIVTETFDLLEYLALRDPIYLSGIVALSLKPHTQLYINTRLGLVGDTELLGGHLCIGLDQKTWIELGATPPPGAPPIDPASCDTEVGMSVLAHEIYHVHPTGGGGPISANEHVPPTVPDAENTPLKKVFNHIWSLGVEEVRAVHAQLCRLETRCAAGIPLANPEAMRRHLNSLGTYSERSLGQISRLGAGLSTFGATPNQMNTFNNWLTDAMNMDAMNQAKIAAIRMEWNL